MESSAEQEAKAFSPMTVTLSGMVMPLSLVLPQHIPAGTASRLSPKVRVVSDDMARRPHLPTLVTVFDSARLVTLLQLKKAFSPRVSTVLPMFTVSSFEHDWNALVPMRFRPSGSVMEVRVELPMKALSPMPVTE